MAGYNRTEAARYLGISRRTFFNWLDGNTQRRFTKRDLDRLAAKHQHPPQALTTLDGLTSAVDKLSREVEHLKQLIDSNQARIAALEQGAKPQRRSRKKGHAGYVSVIDSLAPADTATQSTTDTPLDTPTKDQPNA
jgi:hypothetical protein